MKNTNFFQKVFKNIIVTFLKEKIPDVAAEVSCFSAQNSAHISAVIYFF